MINNLKPNNLPNQLVSVYDYTEYNYNELLCKFFKTINLCVDECNRVTDFTNESHDYMLKYTEETRNLLIEYSEETRSYVDTVNQLTKDFMNWCKEEGIPNETQNVINEMYENGVLEELLNTKTLEKIKTELNEKITTNSNILERTKKVKYGVGCSFYWSESQDTNKTAIWRETLETRKKEIDNVVSMGVKEYPLTLNIGYYEKDGTYFITDDLSILKQAIEYGKINGLYPVSIKFHKQGFKHSHILNNVEEYKRQWKEIILNTVSDLICDTIKYVSIQNEDINIYGNTDFDIFLVDIMQTLRREFNVKVGITCIGGAEFSNVTETIKKNVDYVGLNIYVGCGNKKENTTMEDMYNSFYNDSQIIYLDKYLKEYKNIEFIISESGISDYWEALYSPSNYKWDNIDVNRSNGETNYLYFNMLFKCLNDYNITHLWTWFYPFSYEKTIKLFQDYLNYGGK